MMVKQAKYYILALLISLAFVAQAQNLPHSSETEPEVAKEPLMLCKPGVLNKSRSKGLVLEYGLNSGYNWIVQNRYVQTKNYSEVAHSEHLKGKIKIPIINAPGLKLLAGYEYQAEKYYFDNIKGLESNVFESLDKMRLKTNKFTVYGSKSLNNRHYAVFRLRVAYAGDYQGWNRFDNRYASYSGAAIFGVKPNDYLEWGIGVTVRKNFENTRVVPFLVYNRTFNDKWGVEAVLPAQIYGRYNLNEKSILLFGGTFNSKNYSVDLNANAQALTSIYHVRHAEILFETSLEQHLFSWIWLNVKAGYQLPFRSRFTNAELPAYTFRAKPGGQPFFRIGLFLSPSRKMIK